MRTIDYYGETIEISDYQEQHHYASQSEWAEGFAVNPKQRNDFDCTPNELRDPDEVADWWGKPYILTTDVDQVPQHAFTWAEHVAMHKVHHWPLNTTQAEFEAQKLASREQFMAQFPTGVSYTVRCLDGGAHDRSTWCGEFASLKAAVQAAKQRAGR